MRQDELRENYHLSEWMKLQEEANKEIAATLLRIDERLKELGKKAEELDKRTRHLILYR